MINIQSKNNELINSLAKLKDKQERLNQNLFIVEGFHLVEEAYKHHRLVKVFGLSEEDLQPFKDLDSYLVSEQVIKKLSSTINPQNIVGIAEIIEKQDINNLGNQIVLLDGVSDPGNMGTIIRSAAGLGYSSIISINNCVDYYNDKTVRSSQGAIFKINLVKESIKIIDELKNLGYQIIGTSLKNSINIKELKKDNKFVITLGNEAHGVSDEVLNMCHQNIILPMQNDVESLNVAVAGSIIMWELSK